MLGSMIPATVVSAAPEAGENQEARTMTSDWRGGTPKSVKRGETLVNDIRVNFNKGYTNQKVTRTVTIKAEGGVFTEAPAGDFDKVELSDDKKEVKITATRPGGTAMVISASIIASGLKGEMVSAEVSSDGKTLKTDEVPITTVQGANMVFNHSNLNDLYASHLPDADGEYTRTMPFSLAVPYGTEEFKDKIEFDIQLEGSSPTWKSRDVLTKEGFTETGLIGVNNPATSEAVPTPKNTKIEFKGDGLYHVTMTGFPTDVVKQAAAGARGTDLGMDTDRVFMFTGMFKVRVPVNDVLVKAGADNDKQILSFNATVKNMNVETVSGVKVKEDSLQDNTESFTAIETGTYTAGWNRNSWYLTRNFDEGGHSAKVGDLGSPEENNNAVAFQGDRWSGIPEITPGDTMYGYINHSPVNRDSAVFFVDPRTEFTGRAITQIAGSHGKGIEFSFLTQKIDDPYGQDIDNLSWQKDMPKNPADVTAIKVKWPKQSAKTVNNEFPDVINRSIFQVKAKEGLKTGDDVWAVGFAHRIDHHAGWGNAKERSTDKNVQAPITDNLEELGYKNPRYGWTTLQRDVARIVGSRVSSEMEFADKRVEQGDETDLKVTSGWHSRPGSKNQITTTTTLQPGVEFVSADVKPDSVKKNTNGTTTITWSKKAVETNKPLEYNVKVKAVGTSQETTGYFATTEVYNHDGTLSDSETAKRADSRADISIIFDGVTDLQKRVTQSKQIAGDGSQNTWKLTVSNKDWKPQEVTDVIDVLPYNGDALGSKFSGGYTIDGVKVSGIEGAKIYYTTADPKSLSDDPDHKSNGGLSKPSSIWTTEKPADASKITGVRIVTGKLGVGKSYTADISWTPDDKNRPDDIFVNGAGARATNTKLLKLRSAKSEIESDGSTLKVFKKVKDENPVVRPGSEIRYTVEVKNDSDKTAYAVSARDLAGQWIEPSSIELLKPSHGSAEKMGDEQVWKIGTLKPGESATVEVKAKLSDDYDGTQIVNYATTENPSNPPKGDPAGKCQENDSVDADDDQCDVSTLDYDGALQISKDLTDAAIGIKPGKTFTYTIQVRNSAEKKAGVATTVPDVVVRDIPRTGIEKARFIETSAGEIAEDGMSVNLGDLEAGKTETLTVEAVMGEDAPQKGLANDALVESPLNPPPAEGECEANSGGIETDEDQCDSSELVDGSNIKIDKKLVSKNPELKVGDKLDYEITVLNDAKEDEPGKTGIASDVTVDDIGGDGLENPTITETSKGDIAEDKSSVLIDELAPGERVQLKVSATVTKEAEEKGAHNRATVSSPAHPVDESGECKPNDTVEADDDQCDIESVPAPEKPEEPAPEDPADPKEPEEKLPEKPLPDKPAVQSGGETAEDNHLPLGLAAGGLMAAIGAALGLRHLRRTKRED